MKLATWNVNSLNVRLPRLLAWLALHAPDVVCLQETKLADSAFKSRTVRIAHHATDSDVCIWPSDAAEVSP